MLFIIDQKKIYYINKTKGGCSLSASTGGELCIYINDEMMFRFDVVLQGMGNTFRKKHL